MDWSTLIYYVGGEQWSRLWLFIQNCSAYFSYVRSVFVDDGNIWVIVSTALLCAVFLAVGYKLMKWIYRVIGWTLFTVGIFVACRLVEKMLFPESTRETH